MEKNIADCIEMIKLNAEASLGYAEEILHYKESGYYEKHQAAHIKAKSEDTLKMVGALMELLN